MQIIDVGIRYKSLQPIKKPRKFNRILIFTALRPIMQQKYFFCVIVPELQLDM